MKKIAIILLIVLLLFAVWLFSKNTIFQTKNLNKTNISTELADVFLTDTDGIIHSKKTLQGKYLVVNFWATWCAPCLHEIPVFVDFYNQNKDKVQILGLNYEENDKKTIQKFTNTLLINYPIILADAENQVSFNKFGKITVLPTTFIFDRKGRLIYTHKGELGFETLKKAIFTH